MLTVLLWSRQEQIAASLWRLGFSAFLKTSLSSIQLSWQLTWSLWLAGWQSATVTYFLIKSSYTLILFDNPVMNPLILLSRNVNFLSKQKGERDMLLHFNLSSPSSQFV